MFRAKIRNSTIHVLVSSETCHFKRFTSVKVDSAIQSQNDPWLIHNFINIAKLVKPYRLTSRDKDLSIFAMGSLADCNKTDLPGMSVIFTRRRT